MEAPLSPPGPNAAKASSSFHPSRAFNGSCNWLKEFVTRLPGRYTVGKLDAFEQFRLSTSRWKVAAILLVTPLPCLLVNLVLEAIPLADPATGFRHSLTFQLRHLLTRSIQNTFAAMYKKDCVPEYPVESFLPLMGFGIVQGIVTIATNVSITLATGSYPVPFCMFTPIIPMALVGYVLCFHRQLQGPERRTYQAKCTRVDNRLGVEMLPIVVYPIFSAVFMALPSREQVWLSLLLPVIKLSLRRCLYLFSKADEDLIGTTVSCAGHLYHIMFTDVILQNAKSTETFAFIGLFNTVQMVLNCRYILVDAAALRKATKQLQGENIRDFYDNDHIQNALSLADDITGNLHALRPSALVSTYPRYRRSEFMARHGGLVRSQSSVSRCTRELSRTTRNDPSETGNTDTKLRSTLTNRNSFVPLLKLMKILPWGSDARPSHPAPLAATRVVQVMARPRSLKALSSRKSVVKPRSAVSREVYVRTLTVALHQTEIILLRSYITIFATALHVIYFMYIFALPNHSFFITLASVSTFSEIERPLMRLVFVCALEIGASCVYLALIQRYVGVHGLYQLAFVLRSQWVLVQARFVMLSVMIFGFPLTHYGNTLIYDLSKPAS